MKILIVTSDLPYLGIKHGGGELTFNWIKHLSRSHELSLLAFIREEEEEAAEEVRAYFREIWTVPARRGWLSRIKRLPLLLSRPYPVVATASHRFAHRLQEITSRQHFDLIQFEYFHMGQYAPYAPRTAARALVFHDVVSPVLRQQIRIASGLKKYYYYREWKLSRKWEKWYAIYSGNVLTLSLKDKRVVDSWDVGVRSYVLPPLLNEDFLRLPEAEGASSDLLFLGAMHRPVNIDAVLILKHEILPRVTEVCPRARCLIVGHNPPARVRKLAAENFLVTGSVESIEPYLERCAMLVAPLRVAGGVIVKILQAMAAGRPVVATRIANAGIGAEEEREIVVADRPEHFARQVIALLQDPERARSLGRAARGFIRRRFDPARMGKRIDEIYRELRNGFERNGKRARPDFDPRLQ